MSGAKEIRSKIKSIKSTQKITRAMEMVAASKMRKSQERMRASRPYASRIREVISHLATGQLEYQHPYLTKRPVKRIGLIVISTDRGLCGGLNINLFRAAVQNMRAWHDNHFPIEICTIGRKAEVFFRRSGGNITASISNLGDRPGVEDIIGTVRIMMEAYDEQRIDQLYLISNEFVNTMTQKPRVEMLLPILEKPGKEEIKSSQENYSWDYIYEPDAKELLDALLLRYLESLVYQGVVENGACEQAARMVAMKNASDNAATLITDLQLMYNKARQASITRELSEIVAGAAAV
jgi:F-type H+-transporting ATPase subunit gamma